MAHSCTTAASTAAVHTPAATCRRHTLQQMPKLLQGKLAAAMSCAPFDAAVVPTAQDETVFAHGTQSAAATAFCCRKDAPPLWSLPVTQAATTSPTSQGAPGHRPTCPTPPSGQGPVLTGSCGCAHAAAGLLVILGCKKRGWRRGCGGLTRVCLFVKLTARGREGGRQGGSCWLVHLVVRGGGVLCLVCAAEGLHMPLPPPVTRAASFG